MINLIIFLLILIVLGFCSIYFFVVFNKVSYLNNKAKYAEGLISKDLENKFKVLTKLNAQMKKTLHAKKDYLTNLDSYKNDISDEDKDKVLTDTSRIADDLINDHSKLSTNKTIKSQYKNLKEIDEKLDASKTYFNKYMTEVSKFSTKFPTNVVTKLTKVKIKPLFQTNETIKKISEEL